MLRRDRLLFAVAATLVLLTHLFQPLAEARAAEAENAWVICTMFGMQTASPESKSVPPVGAPDGCSTCIGGPCAGFAVPLRLATAFEQAFPAPVANREAMPGLVETTIPPDRLNEPPPAIRAPPFVLA
ncbi:hypothetical protein [Borborobacter arsenicus]|uniref:hypothetical protein n=1 Tax=Borborobacter arsenicus TaxID=1851146 RepID=UPI001FE1262C|nr:hypothetical protein [Pseudaminobacter arsenicus]